MPTVWAIQLGAGLPFFWPAVRADNACAGADIVAPALRPLGFVLAEKGDGLPAARRLASPAGGGGTALAVTERAFFPLPTPSRVVALSVGFAASSPRGRAKLGAFRSWVRFGLVHTFREVSPFLIRLAWRRATFPSGEGILGRWNSVGAEENPRWRRGHTHERYVSFPQLIEP